MKNEARAAREEVRQTISEGIRESRMKTHSETIRESGNQMEVKASSESIRESAAELTRAAARAGMAHPSRIGRMTPNEIRAEFDALESARLRRLEEMDLLAWLIGRYVSIGVNAPKRYPRCPDAIRLPRAPMSDAEMRRAFARLSERSEKYGGS